MTLKTIDRESTGQLIVKNSRFLAQLSPVSRFGDRLDALRGEHRKASHFVTAIRLVGEDEQIAERSRDDGEPGGTAGMPVLRVLIGAGLVDVGCVVVRYFGGVKLGTGGLARAYSGAAALAVEAAKTRPWVRVSTRTLRADYATASALENTVEALGLAVEERQFTESGVALTLRGAIDSLHDDSLSEWGT